MNQNKTLIEFEQALQIMQYYMLRFINKDIIWNYSKKELYNLTDEGYASYSEYMKIFEYINNEYKRFKRRLYYLKQKEKLQKDKQKLNLLSKSNLLCNDVILYKIAPFMNKFFKV